MTLRSEVISKLVELQFRSDQFEFRRTDQLRMGNRHAEEFAFELRNPEIEERLELWNRGAESYSCQI